MDELAVRADAITKRYEQAVAVDDLSLDVYRGEFLSFLGPSGCGKTTTLRMIAGFIEPDAGTITVMGEDMTNRPPHQRNLGMVFQSYALFPHMTVFDNVAFGLKMRKVPAAERRQRVERALELVQLSAMQQRYPRQLSGGQQQRVALARAIVIEPFVLLLDEPLSNLDAKLRKAMQTELRDLQQRLGITAIYVTHDQEEAMTVSDRIVVMNQGRIMQIGAPEEVYRHPANEFVAGFIGQVNFVRGRLARASTGWLFTGDLGLTAHVADDAVRPAAREEGIPVDLAMRPEAVTLRSGSAISGPCGTVMRVIYTGASTTYQVRLEGGQLLQAVDQDRPGARRWREGDPVAIELAPESLFVVPVAD
ncbi:MAG: ABC transporter ATP-binding protein [Thermomicrobiales bacterium]|nr:ABC transporter ATP-binding protein [Thermomicrobiales bacterium]